MIRVQDENYAESDRGSYYSNEGSEIEIKRKAEADSQSSIVTFNENKNYANLEELDLGEEDIPAHEDLLKVILFYSIEAIQ